MLLAPGAAGIHPSSPVIPGKSLKSAHRPPVRSAPRAEALWKEVENVRLVADPATIIGALDFGTSALDLMAFSVLAVGAVPAAGRRPPAGSWHA